MGGREREGQRETREKERDMRRSRRVEDKVKGKGTGGTLQTELTRMCIDFVH